MKKKTFRAAFFLLLFPLTLNFLAEPLSARPGGEPVIIDASRFLDNLPFQHQIVSASGGDWLYNDFAVRATTRHNLFTRVELAEEGEYHAYIRSSGGRFRLGINDHVSSETIAHNTLALRRVGRFTLSAGAVDLRIMGIDGAPLIDVIVLSPRADLEEEELRTLEYPPEVVMLHDITLPPAVSAVKFGDLTGDGRIDFLVVTDNFSAHAIAQDGRELWRWEAEGATKRHEAPGLVWDLKRNGRAEAIHWRMIDGREWLVAADGATGEILHQTPWPTQPLPHAWSNYRLAIADFGSGYPDAILVFTDSGRYAEGQGDISIAAYDAELNPLWRHQEDKLKDHLGHYAYPIDLTGDGADEILVSCLLLNSRGEEIWNRFDLHFRNQEHMDSIRFVDITGDGNVEIVAACSDLGVQVFRALTGELLWQHNAEHAQQIETGDFLAGEIAAPHIAVGARTYNPLSSQVWWFSPEGQLHSKWPPNRIVGNPVFVKGDWYGDGGEILFWHRFRMNRKGTGELYFGEQVYHMFDLSGNGSEEVITLDGHTLRVYGYAGAPVAAARRAAVYLKNRVANHTHY